MLERQSVQKEADAFPLPSLL